MFHADRPTAAGGFPKRDRILHVGEYRRVYRTGFHASTARFGCYVLATRRSHSRLGLSVSRKYGNAVARNRMKRQLREVFRRLRAGFPRPLDVVMVPRRAAAGLPLAEIAADMRQLVEQALADRRRRPQKGRRKTHH